WRPSPTSLAPARAVLSVTAKSLCCRSRRSSDSPIPFEGRKASRSRGLTNPRLNLAYGFIHDGGGRGREVQAADLGSHWNAERMIGVLGQKVWRKPVGFRAKHQHVSLGVTDGRVEPRSRLGKEPRSPTGQWCSQLLAQLGPVLDDLPIE